MWRGLAIHIIAFLLLVGGIFLGIQGFMNLLIWGSFVYLFLMAVLLFTSSDGLKPNIPPVVSGVFFGAMVIILVWNAHWWVGLSWFLSGLILGHLTDEWNRKQKDEDKNEKQPGPSQADTANSAP